MRKIFFFVGLLLFIVILVFGVIHYFRQSQRPAQIISNSFIAEGGGDGYRLLYFEKLYGKNLKKFDKVYNLCKSLNHRYKSIWESKNCYAIKAVNTACKQTSNCSKSLNKTKP